MDQVVENISKPEVRRVLKRVKIENTVDPDDIPVEVGMFLGEVAVDFFD